MQFLFLRGLQVVLLGGALILSAHAAESLTTEFQLAGRKGCQFVPLSEWHGSTLSWDGSCQAGKAHGRGVLRIYKKDGDTQFFFGNLEDGELRLGVIEGEGYYIAGEFKHGALVSESEPDFNLKRRVFLNASAAAKDFSQRLKRMGNQKSAAFYLKKSQELEQQIE